jgi:hypothetical protein
MKLLAEMALNGDRYLSNDGILLTMYAECHDVVFR